MDIILDCIFVVAGILGAGFIVWACMVILLPCPLEQEDNRTIQIKKRLGVERM